MSESVVVPQDELDQSEGGMDEVVLAKLVAMVTLFLASMFCGLIPMLLARYFNWFSASEAGNLKNSNRVVMALLSFGGGVLLSTTFMHLMPEIDHNVEYLQGTGDMNTFDFSLTPLLTCCGFFIMYLVEELVHLYIHHKEKKNGKKAPLVRNLSVRQSKRGINDMTLSTTELVEEKKDLEAEKQANGHGHSHAAGGHSHMPVIEGDNVTSALRGLLIVLALSIHELFEGLAVGLESSASNVWYMLGAVSAHKLVIAFCIGVELLAVRTKTWLAIVYITTFAVVSPLGIGIGLLLVGGEGATGAGVYSVVLQGLASGTLLYVIFFEIWSSDRTGLMQYCAAVIGFFFMFGLQLLTPHTHSHGHSHDGDDDDHGHSHNH